MFEVAQRRRLMGPSARAPGLSEYQCPPWFDSLPDPWCCWDPGPAWWWALHTQEPGLEWGDLRGKLGLLQGSTAGVDDVTRPLGHHSL